MAEILLLRIDNRECSVKTILPSLLEKINFKYVFENLDCGDFILEKEGKPFFVFERKTLKDLLASIKDGRYKDQKQRMIERFGREKVVYLIEGGLNYSTILSGFNDIESKALKSSIINTQLRDHVKVMATHNLQETCSLIYEIASRVLKDTDKYNDQYNKQHGDVNSVDPVERRFHQSVKKEQFTKTQVFTQQLCQISGISLKTAEAICKEFADMKTFYDTLSPLEHEQKLKLLKNIYLKDNRRINSKVADKIIQYMF